MEGTEADAVETSVETAVAEYSRGEHGSQFSCSLGGYMVELGGSNACDATVAVMNAAIDSYQDGTFEECEMTTPTSSQTTTGTSTLTTTPTTTTTLTTTIVWLAASRWWWWRRSVRAWQSRNGTFAASFA